MKREARRKVKEEMDKLLVEIKDIKTSAATLSRLEVSTYLFIIVVLVLLLSQFRLQSLIVNNCTGGGD